MRKIRSQKLKYLVVGLLLFTVTYIFYWMGSISFSTPDSHSLLAAHESRFHGPMPPAPSRDKILSEREKYFDSVVLREKGELIVTPIIPVQLPRQNNIHASIWGKDNEVRKEKKTIKKQSTSPTPRRVERRKVKKRGPAATRKPQVKADQVKLKQDIHLKKAEQPKQKLSQNKNVKYGRKTDLKHDMDHLTDQFQVPRAEPLDGSYALLHNGQASLVHGQIHKHLQVLPDTEVTDAYIFRAESLAEDYRLRPSIANGYLGTAIHSPHVFVNGLYNDAGNHSHRANIPSTCSFTIAETEPPTTLTREYRLNVGEGIFSEISTATGYTITQRIYAHRNISQLLVVEVDLERSKLSRPIQLKVRLNRWTPSYDITFTSQESGMSEVSYKKGRISTRRSPGVSYTEVHVVYDHVPDALKQSTGYLRTKWVFLTSIATSKDEALQAYKLGAKLVHENDRIYAMHVEAWSDLWQRGHINVRGNVDIAQAVYGSFYNILSSLPLVENTQASFVGLSPSGLAFGDLTKDFEGHVTYHQEAWVSPTLQMFHPDLAKVLLNTRRRQFNMFPKKLQRKDDEFRYPARCAQSGVELGESRRVHVNGDVVLSILRYLYATNDTSIIDKEGYGEILTAIARYWVSEFRPNMHTNLNQISGVIPVDAGHNHVVDNSVYTNTIAQISLEAVESVYKRLNKSATQFRTFADAIYRPLDTSHMYHPAYDGYKQEIANKNSKFRNRFLNYLFNDTKPLYIGTKVNQVEAVMLGYPLMQKLIPEIRIQDLSVYQKVVSHKAPSTTWSALSIGWLEVKQFNKAKKAFEQTLKYVKKDFQVWTDLQMLGERHPPRNTNFLPGMGGFLQNIFFGYGGFRLHDNRLDIDPVLPPGCTAVDFLGVDYLGSTMNIFYNSENDILIRIISQISHAPQLVVYVYKSDQIHTLSKDKNVSIKVTKVSVLAKHLKMPKRL